jgi:hypothetical protein
MHDGTPRVKLNGEPVNQMARIGTFSEEVVCPSEQVVKIREDLPFTHAAIIGCSRRHRHWRRYPARPSPGRLQCAGDLLRRRRAQHRTRRASRRGSPIIACDLRDNKLDYAKSL